LRAWASGKFKIDANADKAVVNLGRLGNCAGHDRERATLLHVGPDVEIFYFRGPILSQRDLAAGADAETSDLLARLASLTPQQVRVLMMLSEGLLNKQIAYELGVSEATVKAHVSAILQKLRVESRTQAVIAAAKIELGQWSQAASAGN